MAAEGLARWVLLLGPHWLVAGVVIALVLWGERRRLASIGLERPSGRDVGWGVIAFVVGVTAFVAVQPLIEALGLTPAGRGVEMLTNFPLELLIAVAVTAGITEEILFRGYPIERLTEVTGNVWVGAAITFVVFTLAHVAFWGVGGALQIGVIGGVLTVLYVHRRNLVACIVMHTLNDLFAFVVVPLVFDGGAVIW